MQADLLYLSITLCILGAMVKPKQKQSKKAPVRNKPAATLRTAERVFESDSTYFLKLVVFILLGTLWLKFEHPITWLGMPLSGVPLGMLLGLILVNKFEKHQSDRKIWYAILLIVTIICYFMPAGVMI